MNITSNKLNVSYTPAQMLAMKTTINNFSSQMPAMGGLTTEEQETLLKIDVDNKVFAEDALNALVNNPTIFPSYIIPAHLQADITLFEQVDELMTMITQLQAKMKDVRLVAGSEAYVAALAIYSIAGSAAKAGVPGAEAIYKQLKARFTGQGKTNTGENAQPQTPDTK